MSRVAYATELQTWRRVRVAPAAVVCVVLMLAAVSTAQPQRTPRANGVKRTENTPTTSTAVATTATAVHQGVLQPANETAAIQGAMHGLTTVPSSDVRIGYHIGEAAAWYESKSGVLSWRDPLPGETNHVAISVQDASDLRVIPHAKITVSFSDDSGKELESSSTLAFMWTRDSYRYGTNVSLPEETTSVLLRVKIDPPDFARMDKQLGQFFTAPVEHEWKDAQVTGRTGKDNKPDTQPERVSFPEGRHPPITPTPYPGSGLTTAPLK
jgi:hypothetical protein